MRCFVTGGAGYLGTSLIAELDRRGSCSEIVVYDNLSRGSYSFFLDGDSFRTPIRFIRGDLLDTRALHAAMNGIDTVVHLAARVKTPFGDQDAMAMDQINHWGTAELSYAIEKHAVRRVVYASSTAVYGHAGHAVSTSDPPAPVTAYGASKLAGEKMLRRLDDCDVCIVRCGNIYGFNRSMRFDAVVNRMAFDATFAGRVRVEGSGEQARSFISVRRAAEVLAEFTCGDAPGDTWDLVEHTRTVNEIADTLDRIHPDMERLSVQSGLAAGSLRVEADRRVLAMPCGAPSDFAADISELTGHFAFAKSAERNAANA